MSDFLDRLPKEGFGSWLYNTFGSGSPLRKGIEVSGDPTGFGGGGTAAFGTPDIQKLIGRGFMTLLSGNPGLTTTQASLTAPGPFTPTMQSPLSTPSPLAAFPETGSAGPQQLGPVQQTLLKYGIGGNRENLT